MSNKLFCSGFMSFVVIKLSMNYEMLDHLTKYDFKWPLRGFLLINYFLADSFVGGIEVISGQEGEKTPPHNIWRQQIN